ncbi:transaldolase family protein [Streptomyces sp. NPDC002215]|uniref:transaldolase family protein n=1 Tax=Streptomyces sp. NPDC002215 TaxID=3154412 RepID=UPI0033244994
MNVTQALHEQGQSIWLDNITRSMLDTGQIQHYIDQYSVTGLTSNPSIFDKAIGSGDYDDAIRAKAAGGRKGEELFFELAIASGVPVNVTLLFSADHYRAAADAYLRGVERRAQAGHDPAVGSVASVFMSRWDVAVKDTAPADLTDTLALAVGLDVYRAYREVMGSQRFQRLENAGARMQRLLWASRRTKDPAASDTLYVHGLAAPFTVNTMPDDTLKAFFDHGEIGEPLPSDGGESEAMLARFANAGVDIKALAAKLQSEGAKSFVAAWNDLMERIDVQSKAVA